VVDNARNQRELSPSAEKHVLEAMQQYEATLPSIEEEISTLDLPKQWFMRNELKKEVLLLQAKLNACRSLLSIKRRVPVEIMGEIFQYYLLPGRGFTIRSVGEDEEDEDDWAAGSGRKITVTPVVLCLVCRHWNAIATATPFLWSKIKFSAYQTTKELWSPEVVLAPQVHGSWSWMDRVAAHPWELEIEIKNFGSRSMQEEVRDGLPMLQVLKHPATPHLKRFKISGTPNSLAVTGLDEITLPVVTSAVINSTSRKAKTIQGGLNLVKTAIPYLPNLTHLTFTHLFSLMTGGPKCLPEQVPWSQLTHLVLGENLFLKEWRAVLRQCFKLQKGTFHLTDYMEDDVQERQELVELTDLRELTTFRSSPFEEPLVDISLSSLERLQIYTAWSNPVVDFTSPSMFDNLTHLTLVSCLEVHGEDIINIVDRLPTLVELFFAVDCGLREVYQVLTYGHEGKFRLRHLRALGMHTRYARNGGVHFPFDALTSLVESRTQAVRENRFSPSCSNLAPLEHLVLRLGVPNEEDVLAPKVKESLGKFASYGIKMTVTVPWSSTRSRNPAAGLHHEVWSWVLKQWPDGLVLDDMDGVRDYSLYR